MCIRDRFIKDISEENIKLDINVKENSINIDVNIDARTGIHIGLRDFEVNGDAPAIDESEYVEVKEIKNIGASFKLGLNIKSSDKDFDITETVNSIGALIGGIKDAEGNVTDINKMIGSILENFMIGVGVNGESNDVSARIAIDAGIGVDLSGLDFGNISNIYIKSMLKSIEFKLVMETKLNTDEWSELIAIGYKDASLFIKIESLDINMRIDDALNLEDLIGIGGSAGNLSLIHI